MSNLQGKNIFVTGGNQGLGKSIAHRCLEAGANVFLFARNVELLEATRSDLASRFPRQQVLSLGLDVSDEKAVNAAFLQAVMRLGSVHGLVNNAGVYGPKGLTEDIDLEQWISALQINLLGTLYPCRFVISQFRKHGGGKIVNLSGGGATAPLPRFSAYACSKAAVVRLTETLAHELDGTGIDINAIAPGALNTRMLDEVLTAGPEIVGDAFYSKALQQKESGGASLDRAAALSVFLLSAESNGITGRLLSAIWDPWEDLPRHVQDLKNSDVFTLRRIALEDRGLKWERP